MGTLLGNVAEKANASQRGQQTDILMGVLGSCKLLGVPWWPSG